MIDKVQAVDMFFYLAIIILAIFESNGQKTCLTISSTQGQCIKIYDCPALFNLLTQPRPLSAETIDTLRKSQCGIEDRTPAVCCPFNDQFPNATNHPNLRLLDDNICGAYTEPKILEGNKSEFSQYPWLALISYDVGKPSPEFGCGGTLISKRYVLTAAHCVTGLPEGKSLKGVRLGEHDLSTEQDCKIVADEERFCSNGYQDFSVESVQVHADFSVQKFQNDIALIKLNTNVDFRDDIKPICLPIKSLATLVPKKKVEVAGWGIAEGSNSSQVLLSARLVIVPNYECTQIYNTNVQKQGQADIWYKNLCAGGENQTNSCIGDSGGPMQVLLDDSGTVKYFQYGVISFEGMPCTIGGSLSVFTSVPYYVDWILDHMTD